MSANMQLPPGAETYRRAWRPTNQYGRRRGDVPGYLADCTSVSVRPDLGDPLRIAGGRPTQKLSTIAF